MDHRTAKPTNHQIGQDDLTLDMTSKKHKIRVGLYTTGLKAYWPQFGALRERLEGYGRFIADELAGVEGAEVFNFGLVDCAEKGIEAGEYFCRNLCDIVFLHIGTYVTSDSVLPVHQICKAPAVVLNLQPAAQVNYAKTTTGYYKNTQSAVEAFQKHNGLEVTGVVDESTWNAIFNDASTVDALSAPKPAYVPTPVPYFFEVDVKNQAVKVWKYNEETADYTDLDRAFICATGTSKYPSPLGTFTLSGRKAAHCKFPKWGGGEAKWWTKITDDIAFHSVLYSDSSNDMTLKVSSYNGLGSPGSHGCIRMTVADAKWIYDHVAAGMQVWIHDDAAADPELKYKVKPGQLNTKTMTPVATPEPPVYPAYDGKNPPAEAERSLSVGKEGADVYWLQMKLKELGFYTGTVTGQYREGTQKAVSAYQRARGLGVDGTAGIKTLNYLYNEVRQANATPTPAPTK